MPVYELILSSDTINEGRIKINNAFSATTGLWSGSTGNQSLIANNDTGNIASGVYAIAEGQQNNAIGDASHVEGQLNSASGTAAHAEGRLNFASGDYSHVEGFSNNAIGSRAHAEGRQTSAYGANAHSEGRETIASGNSSHAEGELNTAYGVAAHVQGSGNIVGGNYSFGGGYNTFSTGSKTFVWGDGNSGYTTDESNSVILGGKSNIVVASFNSSIFGGTGNTLNFINSSSIIGGSGNTVSGTIFGGLYTKNSSIIGGLSNTIISVSRLSDNSVIVGGKENLISSSEHCVILGGAYNEISSNNDFSVIMGRGAQSTSGATLTMGYNGGATSPSSANNTIVFNFETGDGFWDGTVNGGPADYAEYFEWKDGNFLNEDRVGYFVSIDGNKIEKGNSNIIGVISVLPIVAGDSAPLKWSNMYLKDEFGRIYKDSYVVYLVNKDYPNEKEVFIDENNNTYSQPPNIDNMIGILYDDEILNREFLRTETIKRINPEYNHNQSYIPRKDRPEWSPVGLLGKLHVRTSEEIVGTKVSADINGMAINGTDYHVLETIKEFDGNYGIVRILFK
jgi:hypothetical protein